MFYLIKNYMCKNNSSEIIVPKKGKEKKNWCSGDCKKCPFNVFIPPEADTYDWLQNTTKDIEEIMTDIKK